MKKVILFVVLFIVLMLVSVAIWAYFAFLYTKPLNKAELAELTPDWTAVTHGKWSPWFVEADGTTTWNPAASFNAWLDTVPEEDKAWPVLVDVVYRHKELFNHDDIGRLPDDADDWEGLAELLKGKKYEDVLERLMDALNQPVMGCGMYATTDPYEHDAMERNGVEDVDWDPAFSTGTDLLAVLTPALGKHQRSVKVLISYAVLRIENGDIDGGIAVIESVMDSSLHDLEFPSLIGQLVAIAVLTRAQGVLVWAVDTHVDAFTDERLSRVDRLLKKHQTMGVIWETEVLVYHDFFRRFASPSGGIDYGQLKSSITYMATPDAYSEAVSLSDSQLKPSLQRPLYLYGKGLSMLKGQAELPWDDRGLSGYEYIQSEIGTVNIAFKLITDIMVPATGKFTARVREYNQRSLSTRLLFALYRHRIRHGVFPESISALDVDILAFEPIDSFTGEMLKYKLTLGGPIIYSVGTDRDDDGGVPMRKYDINDLESTKQVMAIWKNRSLGYAKAPHWLSQSEVDEINQRWPEKIDGDWVLYPTPKYD